MSPEERLFWYGLTGAACAAQVAIGVILRFWGGAILRFVIREEVKK